MRKSLVSLLCLALAVPGAATVATAVTATTAAAYPVPNITFTGHGYGHGRGMGQYGAYGYASDYGWTYQQILGHYYGGTQLSTAAPTDIPVSIDEMYQAVDQTFYVPGSTLTVDGVTAPAIRVHGDGGGNYTIYGQSGCSSPTTASAGPVTTVTINPPAPNNTASSVIELCQLGSRAYQGSFTVSGGVTVNTLPLDQYVAGVVPSESPASWGAAGGEAALQAQAVAARSYALAYVRSAGRICDTQYCQVYGGDPDLGSLGSWATYSDNAVTSTANQVLLCVSGSTCGSAGSVALAEYSSSTGGYTAGGAFPAVPDLGDAVASNPNHNWTTTLSVSSIQAAYPQIGSLNAVSVTQRNGLGDMGGRVLQMVVSGTSGSVTVSGAGFAAAMGLKSDWFEVTQPATPPSGGVDGYWITGHDASVFAFGNAPYYGSMAGHPLNAPVVGLAPTHDQAGYWEVGSDGGIFTFGDAPYLGGMGGHHLNKPVIAMAAAPQGGGYWELASDGGVFTFGDAGFYGSTGNMRLNQPVVGMAPTPDGRGYWLVASDGGVFTFGDAGFYGSTGNMRLNQPVVGIVPTADGRGYWLVARDGGVFTFGDANFLGSLPGEGVKDTITALTPTADAKGYLLVSANGTVYPFGDAPFLGDVPQVDPGYSSTVLGIAAHHQ